MLDMTLPEFMAGGYVAIATSSSSQQTSMKNSFLALCSDSLAMLLVAAAHSTSPLPLLQRVDLFEWVREEISEIVWAPDLITAIPTSVASIEHAKFLSCLQR